MRRLSQIGRHENLTILSVALAAGVTASCYPDLADPVGSRSGNSAELWCEPRRVR
jgi:hypothetical protein